MRLSQIYKTTYKNEYDRLPSWKKLAIDEDRTSNKHTGISEDFVRGVIQQAESQFDEKLKAKKKSKKNWLW